MLQALEMRMADMAGEILRLQELIQE